MKKLFKILFGIFLLLVICITAFHFSFFQGNIYVKDGIVQGKSIKKENLKSFNSNTMNYEFDKPLPQIIQDLNIKILNTEVPKEVPILVKSQRYYLPLDYLSNLLNFKYDDNIIQFQNNIIEFINSTTWKINNTSYSPRGELLNFKDKLFISISDIEYLFNLTAIFNSENKEISILNSQLDKSNLKQTLLKDGKVALLRLEDVTAGGSFIDTSNQAKFKAIADYLYENNFKFNIAWVPRYIHPENNIDNDLLRENNISNAGFINMLDYLINSNGQVGLHGYTHQSENTISTVGSELTYKDNSSEEDTVLVIEHAITTANSLNIPVHFFESPHYHATKKQKEIIGTYFQYQYEPYNLINYINLKTTSNNNLFIPTPLSYVKERNPESIIKKLKNPPPNFLASMFYHPALEFDYITITTDNNLFSPTFSDESIIKTLIPSFIENGYTAIHPTDFGN